MRRRVFKPTHLVGVNGRGGDVLEETLKRDAVVEEGSVVPGVGIGSGWLDGVREVQWSVPDSEGASEEHGGKRRKE